MSSNQSVIRVAYAEDHVMLRTALTQNIESNGTIEVIVQADNGAMLINALQGLDVLPQVVLMDIEMPEMNGYDASRFIKKQWPEIKILAITGHESEPILHKMIRYGADGYIVKRAETEELLKAIVSISKGEVYNTELLCDGLQAFHPPEEPLCATFSPMEVRLLQLCAYEQTVEELAHMIGYKPKSVNSALYRLYKKVGVNSSKGLLLYAIKYGFVKLEDL